MNAPSKSRELETLLSQWERRWRLVRILRLLPRIFSGALTVGILLTVMLATLRLFPPSMLVGVVFGVVAGLIVVLSGSLQLFGRQGMESARYFDRQFRMQERLSTALEVLEGDAPTTPELAEFQFADTLRRARAIDPREALRFQVRRWEWLVTVILLVILLLALGWVALSISAEAFGMGEETQLAVTSAREEVGEITETIATDSGLTDEERDTLLESLEMSLDELQSEDLTGEDAFVELSELESDLRAAASEIRNELELQQAAEEAAATALNLDADESTEMAFDQQMQGMAEALPELTEEEQEAAADALDEAADALEETDPETAEDLREAADAMREGDPEAAQEALSNAQESASESQQAQQQRRETAENLEESADRTASAAEEVAASESSENEPRPSLPEDVPQAPAEEGASSGQAQQDEEAQLGEEGQTSTENEEAPSGDVAGEANEGDSDEGGGESSSEGEEQGGGGAGTNESQERQEGGAAASSGDLGSNEAPGTSESEYEAIYSPQSDLPEGSDEVVELDTTQGDTTNQAGEFQENPAGSAQMPYNEVFQEYADSASRTLESETIPLGMRDVVRDYFNALAPQEP